jgi:hypothetical protein
MRFGPPPASSLSPYAPIDYPGITEKETPSQIRG